MVWTREGDDRVQTAKESYEFQINKKKKEKKT